MKRSEVYINACNGVNPHFQPWLYMQEENIKAKQVRPKQFSREKRIWEIYVHKTEKTLERKEGKMR
jgi:hypothetical protein